MPNPAHQPALLPECRRPVICDAHWRQITAGCTATHQIERAVEIYRAGWWAGRQSVSESIHAAIMGSMDSPVPPEKSEDGE